MRLLFYLRIDPQTMRSILDLLPQRISDVKSIPITILAGSDHTAGPLPESGAGLHALAAFKGAEIKVGGKSLIELLVKSLARSDGFGPVTIAGPAEIYEPLGLNAELVDTNGTVATNLRAAIEAHLQTHESKPMALLAYDIVLTPDDLNQLSRQYEKDEPCAMWLPFVRKPHEEDALGPFAWKPSYRVHFEPGDQGVQILPGHLAIFHPETLRLPLLYKLLDLAYQTRNHPVEQRRGVMIRSVLADLFVQDLKIMSAFQLPRLTFSVILNGLRLAKGLRNGGLTITELETVVSGIFLRHNSELRGPTQGVRHPVVDILRLAEDIDTEEEAREMSHSQP